jgi:uncharacterized protein YndB with AHSA1/START domain
MSLTPSVGGRARAVADLVEGHILATVEVTAAPERVFLTLASAEITEWWVRPGVFDTREWTGDLRVGGPWRATGMGGGRPYALEGEFLEVSPPRKLVHTWHPAGAPGAPTTVTYLLERLDSGTRVTLRHIGFTSRETCLATCIGWETSFERLAAVLM